MAMKEPPGGYTEKDYGHANITLKQVETVLRETDITPNEKRARLLDL